MPVATTQHAALSVLSRLVQQPETETLNFSPNPGQRLGVSLIMLQGGQLKVAGLSEGGLAKNILSKDDTILEINGRGPLSERSAYQILRNSNHVTMKIVKRSRSDASSSENSTERTTPPTDEGSDRDARSTPPSLNRNLIRASSSFSRRSKVAAL
jgi:hypothetical protein